MKKFLSIALLSMLALPTHSFWSWNSPDADGVVSSVVRDAVNTHDRAIIDYFVQQVNNKLSESKLFEGWAEMEENQKLSAVRKFIKQILASAMRGYRNNQDTIIAGLAEMVMSQL